MLARCHLKKGAGYAWLSKFDQAIECLQEASKFKGVFGEREVIEILNDIDRIKIRQKSIALKADADLKFAESSIEEATALYE